MGKRWELEEEIDPLGEEEERLRKKKGKKKK